MKKKMTLGMVLFISMVAVCTSHAQSLMTQTIDLKNLSVNDRSYVMGEGFPISSYKFDNQMINTHLQSGLENRKLAKTFATIGYIGMGAGLLLATVAGGSSGGLVLGGVGSIGGGASVLVGYSKRAKSRRDIMNATVLYNEMKSQ